MKETSLSNTLICSGSEATSSATFSSRAVSTPERDSYGLEEAWVHAHTYVTIVIGGAFRQSGRPYANTTRTKRLFTYFVTRTKTFVLHSRVALPCIRAWSPSVLHHHLHRCQKCESDRAIDGSTPNQVSSLTEYRVVPQTQITKKDEHVIDDVGLIFLFLALSLSFPRSFTLVSIREQGHEGLRQGRGYPIAIFEQTTSTTHEKNTQWCTTTLGTKAGSPCVHHAPQRPNGAAREVHSHVKHCPEALMMPVSAGCETGRVPGICHDGALNRPRGFVSFLRYTPHSCTVSAAFRLALPPTGNILRHYLSIQPMLFNSSTRPPSTVRPAA